MPVGLIRKDYLLNEALELVGMRLYHHDWTGQELFARKIASPVCLLEQREPLEAAIAAEQRLIDELGKEESRTVDAARILEIKTERSNAFARRSDAYQNLDRLPDSSDESYLKQYETFERRKLAEKCLIDALGRGKIEAYILGSMVVPSELWRGQRGFAYDLILSAVCMPRQYSGQRRGSVRIRKTQFDPWLSLVLPDDAADRADFSPEDRCRAFLIEAIRSGPKTKTRDAYREEAIGAIPGLSQRAFLQAWAEMVPLHWKKQGRPRSQKK